MTGVPRHLQARAAEEASRRALYAAISHDLRTPLSTMRAMVEAMTDGVVSDPATCSRYLRAVSSEIDHLTSLINDLFELTKIEEGDLKLRLEWLNVTEVLRLRSFRPQLERPHRSLAEGRPLRHHATRAPGASSATSSTPCATRPTTARSSSAPSP
jgi:signal transduction histidine kinase